MDVPIRKKSPDDDWDLVDATQDTPSATSPLRLHPLPSKDALLVKIQPPREPEEKINHVACDIVLVIDISASMSSPADVPGESPEESPGLSVLDLVKHAAMTIIETLDEGDRLGIVTFETNSEIVRELTPMTPENKDDFRKRVKSIHPRSSTNLWHGMLDGMKVFKNGGSSTRASSIMVLTDGQPNHMNPSMGFIPKLQTMLPLPAPISTFAFGYSIKSGLLKSIAEIGGGNYAFIPDAGMIGTVFVHAVANLQSTFATDATLELQYSQPLEVEESTGVTVDQNKAQVIDQGPNTILKVSLGNLQFGQSRDLFLRVKNANPFDEKDCSTITAKLFYNTTGTSSSSSTTDKEPMSTAQCNMLSDSSVPEKEVAYHESRSRICEFLASIFPLKPDGIHESISTAGDLPRKASELKDFIQALPAKQHGDDRNKSLIEDLIGTEPHGQVSIAINDAGHFIRWGRHYLPSLLNAHTRQMCNSFKDPGPLLYGVDSPLFVKCRTDLDSAFDNLPAPEPSLPRFHQGARGGMSVPSLMGRAQGRMSAMRASISAASPASSRESFSMARYRNASGVCFAGSTPVDLASGRAVPIRKLRRGIKVRTPLGPRKVAAVLKTRVEQTMMCRLANDILVTPWHPVSADGKTFAFPASLPDARPIMYTGFIYSIMLQRDDAVAAHGIRVGRCLWGVTLGHGLVGRSNDVRGHHFFGDYNTVGRALVKLGMGPKGVVHGSGVVRDARTGLVVGFRAQPKK